MLQLQREGHDLVTEQQQLINDVVLHVFNKVSQLNRHAEGMCEDVTEF